jgi:hypothetical protein
MRHHLESPHVMELAEPLELRKLFGEQSQHDPFSLLFLGSDTTGDRAGVGGAVVRPRLRA